MKFLISTVLFSLTTVTACGQSFEAKIVYENSFKSKLSSVSDAQFTSLMGSRQVYFIKGGNYKSVSNGTSFSWQIYVNKDNKLYNKFADSETIFWSDGGLADEPILETIHNKNVAEILGYKCDELILKSKSKTEKYYFNSKLGVDVKLYARHLFGNWYEYLQIAKALPLKMVIDDPEFTMTSVAMEVETMKLDDREFQLPLNPDYALERTKGNSKVLE